MNKEQLQKLVILANRQNETAKQNNDDYSPLSFALFIVLTILFISFICLLVNL